MVSEGPLVQPPTPNVKPLDQAEALKLPIHLLPHTFTLWMLLFKSFLRIKKEVLNFTPQ